VSTLEQRYRKVIRLLPKAYRAERSEEILGTLLDDARPGQKRPQLREVASLGGLALRLRFGAPGASPGGERAGQVARRVILIGLLIGCLDNTFGPTLLVINPDRLHAFPSVETDLMLTQTGNLVLFTALLLSLLRGWWRTGRVLSIVGVLALAAEEALQIAQNLSFPFYQTEAFAVFAFPAVFWLLNSITLLAVIPAFHRQAPRVGGQPWWILLWALLCCGQAVDLGTYVIQLVVVAAAVGLGIAVRQAVVSSVWPIALVIASWPAFLGAIETYATQGSWDYAVATATLVVACAADAFLLCTALVFVAVRRRRVAA
jgi:hypothetical protein